MAFTLSPLLPFTIPYSESARKAGNYWISWWLAVFSQLKIQLGAWLSGIHCSNYRDTESSVQRNQKFPYGFSKAKANNITASFHKIHLKFLTQNSERGTLYSTQNPLYNPELGTQNPELGTLYSTLNPELSLLKANQLWTTSVDCEPRTRNCELRIFLEK